MNTLKFLEFEYYSFISLVKCLHCKQLTNIDAPCPTKSQVQALKNPMVNKAHQLIIPPAVSINCLMHRLYSWAGIMDKKSCQWKTDKSKKREQRKTTQDRKESSSSAASELGAVLGTWGGVIRLFKETEPLEDTDHLWIDMIKKKIDMYWLMQLWDWQVLNLWGRLVGWKFQPEVDCSFESESIEAEFLPFGSLNVFTCSFQLIERSLPLLWNIVCLTQSLLQLQKFL